MYLKEYSVGVSNTHITMVLRRRKRSLRPWESRAFHNTISVIFVVLLSKSQGFSMKPSHKIARTKNTPATRCGAKVSTAVVEYQTSFESTSDSVGLYVHIPYCRRRCRYCDFAIVPIGQSAVTDGNVSDELQEQEDIATSGFLKMDASYRMSVLKEIGIITKTCGDSIIPLRSIYFGGGTPSLAPIETLAAILSATTTAGPFALEKSAEISIEMDPGTFSRSKLQSIKEMGFNRVSLGVQSFDDTVLESIGRCHRREDIYESIYLLKQVYGDDINYSIDLISGLPGVSLAKWAETLEIATSLSPSHLSIYDLQVERGTVFGRWYDGQDDAKNSPSEPHGHIQASAPVTVSALPSMEECAFCYKYASRYLRAKGYEHYEISSYANGNDSPSVNRSRHNQIYWEPGSQWFGKNR
jgi:oxygen-independent coproporphyrinogen-3 oxidase